MTQNEFVMQYVLAMRANSAIEFNVTLAIAQALDAWRTMQPYLND